MKPFDDGRSELYYLGHGIECIWFIIDEAVRLKDDILINLASTYFKEHCEKAWDEEFEGLYRGFTSKNQYDDYNEKLGWVH